MGVCVRLCCKFTLIGHLVGVCVRLRCKFTLILRSFGGSLCETML